MKKILVIFILLILSLNLYAQDKGRLAGKVTDKSNNNVPLPGVNLLIDGTYYGAATDFDGNYIIENISSGTYNISVSFIGYKAMKFTGIVVKANSTTNLDVELEETSLTIEQDVIVVGEKPLLDVEETQSKTTIGREDIENAVIENILDVVSQQAGVVKSDNAIHIRGGRAYESAYLLDGVSVQDPLSGTGFGLEMSANAIEEVEVITGGFNAEYGNVRSGLVNIITKEGGNKKYSGTITFRVSPAQSKHFGHSIYDPNSYFNRPYLDPDVAWTGTNNGAWDQYTQGQYYIFEGWNAVSERTLQDKDPTNDLTPQGAQRLFQWQRRRQGDIEKPDYIVDLGFGGPFPFVGDMLGNLRFYISYFKEQNMFVFPLSRDNYGSNHTQLKFNSEINPSMKLLFSGLYGEVHSVSPYSWKTTPTGRVLNSVYEVANLTNSSSGNSVLYMPGYYSPSSIYRTFLNAKFLHVLSPVTFYEVRLQYKRNNYSTYQMS
ncbi:MAG: carboxypeptidase-like regulatory domain-containing protein, partial [Melioribacteraceae bacterium]|nr:carboxypeptidase-like regulatory domain-containing protein [Melioribacteraceae bacterium]